MTAPEALILQPGEGERLDIRGNRLVIKAAAPRVTLIEYTVGPGFAGPPLHVHSGFDEVFVVLDGVLTVRVGGDAHDLGPGGTVYVSGATAHTFTNATAEPLRVLVVCAPGGFEGYFRGLARGDDELTARVTAELGYAGAAA